MYFVSMTKIIERNSMAGKPPTYGSPSKIKNQATLAYWSLIFVKRKRKLLFELEKLRKVKN